jgi:hypothetical protein
MDVDHHALRKAWEAFDKTTAYWCARRGEPYDEDRCRRVWEAYRKLSPSLPKWDAR